MSDGDFPQRFLIRSAAAVTGGILLTTVWALTRGPPPLASCRLSDGSVLRLEAVTCGPVHRFKSGPYWQRLLAQLPFSSLRALAGDPTREIRGATPDSLLFWTTRAELRGKTFLGSAQVINERGCPYCLGLCDVIPARDRPLVCWEAPAAPIERSGVAWRGLVMIG